MGHGDAETPRGHTAPPGVACDTAVDHDAAQQLRAGVQQFVRSFGLLAGDQTPCGQPLAPSHAHALMLLLETARAGKRTNQRALAAALGIDKSSAARLCEKMERVGHVDQARSPADGRARLLGLTTKGRRVAEQVEAASRARFQQVLEAMPSPRMRDSVIEALAQLNQAVALVCTGTSAGPARNSPEKHDIPL